MRGLLRGICQDRQVWSLEKQRRRKQTTHKSEQRHPAKEENFIIDLDWRRGTRMDSYLVIVDGSKDDVVYRNHYKSKYQSRCLNISLKSLSSEKKSTCASYSVREGSEPRPYRGRRLSDSEIAVKNRRYEEDKLDGQEINRESRSSEVGRRIVHARYYSETEVEETTVDMISTDRGDASTSGGDALATNTAESETISTDIEEIETVEVHEHSSCTENIDIVMSTLPHRHVLADPSLESQLKIDNLR